MSSPPETLTADVKKFDCADCVAFCCAGDVYRVSLTGVEVARLALRFNVATEGIRARYVEPDGVTLALKPDPLFGRACVFLDLEERRCTVYQSRPDACRVWPRAEHAAPGAEGRCGFYDLYAHVRNECEPAALPLFQLVRVTDTNHPATLPNPRRSAAALREGECSEQ